MSKFTAYYHIVFSTRQRKMAIPLESREDVYRVIWKILTDNKCRLLRIGGIQNHVHMLINLHPTVALSDLMKRVKGISSSWMRGCGMYPQFDGWSREYFACTISPQDADGVIEYIKNQESHHLGHQFDEELKDMHIYACLEYNPNDMR